VRLLKLGAASINSTVGAVETNADRVIAYARRMAEEGVTIGCFPEQVLGGYPPEDLVQWGSFIAAQWEALLRVALATSDLTTVLALGLVIGVDGLLFNAAAVLHHGHILGLVPKDKLPTYDVFYEARTLSSGGAGLRLDAEGIPLGDLIFTFDFGTLAVEVCEDAWSPDGPMRRRCFAGAELVLNLSASPFRTGVVATRREMLATRSADNQTTLLYTNRVGEQDGLIFDGGALLFQNGRLTLDAPRFVKGLATAVVDLDRTRRLRRANTTWRRDAEAHRREGSPVMVLRSDAPTADRSTLRYPTPHPPHLFLPPPGPPPRPPREQALDDLLDALALGVADYARKAGPFATIGVALSGGRDSLLTLLIAWRARERIAAEVEMAKRATTEEDAGDECVPEGGVRERGVLDENVAVDNATGGIAAPALVAFYMPTRYSRPETAEAARLICRELGVPFTEVSIDDAFERELEATRAMLGGGEPTPLTRQNIQARLRAARMWNWANTAGALFLQTGDMSEKAVGYTTIGGDLEGGLAPIANLPKTVVIALLEHLQARYHFEGIARTLATEASPELEAEQRAEDELMPFPVLDACLHLYAEEKLSAAEVAKVLPTLFPELDAGALRAWAHRFTILFTRSIYKWVQAPLSLHLGALDLERERALQIPVIEHPWGPAPDL
jgi:NAD+ synthase (glutamine-hydrolysing)